MSPPVIYCPTYRKAGLVDVPADMPFTRWGSASVLTGDVLNLIGGNYNGAETGSHLKYNFLTDSWTIGDYSMPAVEPANTNYDPQLHGYSPAIGVVNGKTVIQCASSGAGQYQGQWIEINTTTWEFSALLDSAYKFRYGISPTFQASSYVGRELMVLGGDLYVIAGLEVTQYKNTGDKYDPATNSWSTFSSPLGGSNRWNYSCHLIGSRGYILGGRSGSTSYASDIWRSAVDDGTSWTSIGSLSSTRALHGSAVSGSKIYVAGGVTSGGTVVADFGVFDIDTQGFTALASMPEARYDGNLVVYGGRVYHFGGYYSGAGKKNCFVYNIAANTWAS